MAEKLRFFRFMESWLDDMADWEQEDKNFAIWKLINYGIYGNDNLDDVPKKEQAWYKNAFRVIDKGGEISAECAVKGSHGGSKNRIHDHSRIKEALLNGCEEASQVAEYIEGPGADPGWLYKDSDWKNRIPIWKANGIPVDSKGKPDFSRRIPLENKEVSSGKSLESAGIPMESNRKSLENKVDSNGIPTETVGKIKDSNGNCYDF